MARSAVRFYRQGVAVLVLAAVLFAGGIAPVVAQDEGLDTERIIQNLKMEIPQLRQTGQISISSFSESDVNGFHEATLTVNGRQIPLLVTEDGEQALLLAGPPLNVSRSLEEVEKTLADETSQRNETLKQATAGMPVRGPTDAPVTLVEFSDFQCPYCARASTLVDQLMERFPETLNVIYVHYPLPMHEWARPAAIASQCAAQQDDEAFWTLHDAYFDNQSSLTADNVMQESESYLAEASIDITAWKTCATDESSDAHKEAAQTVSANMQAGESVNVTGTPSFFINGEQVQGARSVDAFARRIEQAAEAAGGASSQK
jgi:protein-disulfide isomerase